MSQPSSILSLMVTRCRQPLMAAFAFSAATGVLTLASALYTLQVFDRVLSSGSMPTLAYLTLATLMALALQALIDEVRSETLTRLGHWFDGRLSPSTFGVALDGVLGGRDHRMEMLADLATIRGFMGGSAIGSLFDAPWAPLYIAVVTMIHPLLGAVALAGALLLAGLAAVTERVIRRATQPVGVAALRSQRFADVCARNAEVIDAMGMLPAVTGRWSGLHARSLAGSEALTRRTARLHNLSKLVRIGLQVVLMGAGAMLVVDHQLTAGAMTAAAVVMSRGLAPIEQAIGTWRQARHAWDAFKRLQAAFSATPTRGPAMTLPAPDGRLAVESVGFAVAGRAPILRGISFALEPGDAVALIGPSAAGKSTLARLLVGVRRPSAGCVRLDGADIATLGRGSVGAHIGYLPQDVELFAGTVAENIARLGPADPDRVVEAARLAGVHDMILRLPQGYDTDIGEGGSFLSGGQRQRVALARALFGRPRLIVLDEPNSNLDAEGEEALNKAIAALRSDKAAVVVIGHRPSVLAQVNKVMILHGGQVEAFGPPAEVLRRMNRPLVAPAPFSPSPGTVTA